MKKKSALGIVKENPIQYKAETDKRTLVEKARDVSVSKIISANDVKVSDFLEMISTVNNNPKLILDKIKKTLFE